MTDAHLQPFAAEVGRVLDLVVHSLYTNRDIFLRELISNASDACDRLRYEALERPELLGDAPDLAITVTLDQAARTLTVADNGIGMTRDEMAEDLGTIARSGTARLRALLSGDRAKDSTLIGQFGVGFYSSFMVAEEVVVVSRKAGSDEVWAWASNGRDGFALREAEGPHGRGTSVVLHVREDAKDYLEEARIRHIVRTYSDHVGLPIRLVVRQENADGEPAQVNQASALWTRPKGEITDEQYAEFYHHAAHAFDQPWARIHFKAEGLLSYTALLFIPGSRPFDLYDPHRKHGAKLYVRRVFITDSAEGLLPRYLRFVAGVVDSEDLELNVSRETLQHGAVVAKMRKALTGRILGELKRRAEAEDGDYATFWEHLGAVLKEGIYEDGEHRDELLALTRFRSTRGAGWVSPKDYVAGMKPGQDAIYYVTGEDEKALRASPQIEACRAKDVEVLLLTDAVDSFWTGVVDAFEGKKLVSLTRGEVDLSAIAGEAASAAEESPGEAAGLDRLIAVFKDSLGSDVRDVRRSKRLTDSPVCLIASDDALDMRVERILRDAHQLDGPSSRILEVNPNHALIRRLAETADDTAKAGELGEIARLLLDQARIVEGEPLPDPAGFARRLSEALSRGLAA